MVGNRQPNRLPDAGSVDRDKPLRFTFNGKSYTGFAGDTLAAALLANGVDLIGRSFKYHRPRGVFSAGTEEPNALVTVGKSIEARPNLRATEVYLTNGMTARSQNCWPSVEHDIGAATGLISRVIGAGFYYKTFMWPAKAWKTYEYFIRHAAGLGSPPEGHDDAGYDHRNAHCDILVIGGGPAGLAAATAAAQSGARVMLCDDRAKPGGTLAWLNASIDGIAAADWATGIADRLDKQKNLTRLQDTTAFAVGDGNHVLLEQRLGWKDRRLWKVRPKRIVLAGGAIERPIVFPGNDRPGVMMASAVRRYLHEFGVRPGKRAAIVTNNDSGYDAIADLKNAGIGVACVIDIRDRCDETVTAKAGSVPVHIAATVTGTQGRKRLSGIDVETSTGKHHYDFDIICVAGGWTPGLQLYSQRQGKLRFDETIGAHLPVDPASPMAVVGAAAGTFGLHECLQEGWQAGNAAAAGLGFAETEAHTYSVACEESVDPDGSAIIPVEAVLRSKQKAFVDLQNDVTCADLSLALGEGFISIEHVKRYTTTGMGTDQGKTSNVNAIKTVAAITGVSPSDIGHTTFRPPFSPVSMGAIAGDNRGKLVAPTRRTPFHATCTKAGVVFLESGDWLYPRYYPKPGESMAAAIEREVTNTRQNVGMVDMSSLGKIDVQGPDTLAFLERVYCNNLATLKTGRIRYSLMLREDGILFDDGTVTKLGDNHFLVTTTTARAGSAWMHMDNLRQAHWPDLKVSLTSVTDVWASIAVAGPKARDLVQSLTDDIDCSADAFPPSSMMEGTIDGMPVRIFRVSFSGELGFEINILADHASTLWDRLEQEGEAFGLMPYGLEALDIMRIEKGHVSVGTEIDGRTTASDVGLGRMVSTKKDFIGKALLQRPAFNSPGRRQLVGLKAKDGKSDIPYGAQIAATKWTGTPQETQGHSTACIKSPTLGESIALALVVDGHDRLGETVWAVSPVANASVQVEITSPHFYDPDGTKVKS
ncbi:MAG: sarcosine oxidase subunit alpha family protein [Alphaproteobacteria bacterium]